MRTMARTIAAGTALAAAIGLGAGSAPAATDATTIGVSAAAVSVDSVSAAQSAVGGSSPFVSFDAYLSGLSATQYTALAQRAGAGAVRDQATFDQMRSYALHLYQGVQVTHSFTDNGGYFDCVVTMTQPSVHALGITALATPPPALPVPSPGEQAAGKAPRAAKSRLTLGLKDVYGNAVSCPRGTIPMQRLSLQRLTRFPTLNAFLAKEPDGSRPPSAGSGSPFSSGGGHRYAVGYNDVANHGGNSWLNLWNPSGDFSLSQQWYLGTSGAGVQSVEGGWVRYPAAFGDQSVLFTFFTPDDYASGCYNLDCGAFVQTDNSYGLGVAWTDYSTTGGDQWGFGEQWRQFDGAWWLFIQGTAIGYYPDSLYGSGPLSTGQAGTYQFGGETYTAGTSWPQMGSGWWAAGGYGYAAFQNSVYYFDPADVIYSANLFRQSVTNPNCYTFDNHPGDGVNTVTYFFFGGPGGIC